MRCMLCGEVGDDVAKWTVVTPDAQIVDAELCRRHARPLRVLANKGPLRKVVGIVGLDQLVDDEEEA